MIAEATYALCALTSIACAGLLIAGYRASRARLLLWSSLGFCGLAINNVILFVDKVVAPGTDLSMYRATSGLVGVTILLAGLVWDAE